MADMPVPVTVDVADLAARLDELVALAAAGTPVVIRAGGRDRATLGPPPTPSAPPAGGKREWVFGLHAGQIVMADDFDDYVTEEQFLRGDI